MHAWLTLGIVFVSALTACGNQGDQRSSGQDDNFTNASWQSILTCDGAVVDVDASARTHLQLVIRETTAFPWFDNQSYGEIKNSNERIYYGDSPFGIFNPSDFRHLRKFEVIANASGHTPGFDIIRDGGGLKFRALDLSRPACEPFGSGRDDVYPAECEVANFVFNNCH
jgi:hypothetical protein